MTIPYEDRSGYIAAADPDWLDTLESARYDRMVYYKSPYNPPKLPTGSWFLCYRRGEHPPALHLSGIVTATDELSLDEAWSHYGLYLGVGHRAKSHDEWITTARTVLREHNTSVYCIELRQPRWYDHPILLSYLNLIISGGTGQMGQALSHDQIRQCEEALFSAPPIIPPLFGGPSGTESPSRRTELTISRIIRSSALIEFVKSLYEFKCQVCRKPVDVPDGFYVEGAHIQPIGWPHHRPDDLSNVLCLCPNHHVQFDYGQFSISDDFSLLGIEGNLQVDPKHKLSRKRLHYHRQRVYVKNP
jgi:HNH endonuclease